MTQLNSERLQALSERIREEETDILMEHLAKSMVNKTEPLSPEDIRKQTEQEKYATIYLRSLRIHMCLEYMAQGQIDCKSQFQEDWKEIIECIKFVEYEWNVTKELLSNAVDIVLLLDPSKRDVLLKQLDLQTRLKVKKQKPLNAHVFFCATHMFEYCLSKNHTDDLCAMAQNLIALSEERNERDYDMHREVVRRVLWYIVDTDHKITCQICDRQKLYFEGVEDFDASRFYWFYAVALTGVDRSEEAVPLFKLCHDLCLKVEGEDSWIGARAGTIFHYSLINSDREAEAEAYLWDVLAKIDESYYPYMDGSSDFVSAYTRSVLLKLNMERQTLRSVVPEIERFRDYCYQNDSTAVNPRLTIRYAENILSSYYLEAGDYLQAADHAIIALNALPPAGVEAIPSDIIIYTNILLIYSVLNDTDQMIRYYELLVEALRNYEDNMYVMSRAFLILNTVEKKLGVHGDSIEDDREFLNDLYIEIKDGVHQPMKTPTENNTYALWVLDQAGSLLDTFACENEELCRIEKIIYYFQDHPDIYVFNDVQKMVCHSLLAQTKWQLKDPSVEKELEKTLRYSAAVETSNESRISTLRFAAAVYYTLHKQEKYLPIIDETLTCITDAWHKATAYLNDQKVCQLLSFIQHNFNICYSFLRTTQDVKELYETVLRFKDLPALVGRERNRLLRLAPVDESLRKEIFDLQDMLAAAELSDSLQGTETAQELHEKLQQKEALFAERFPQNLAFTDISFERVCKKLPVDSAIVEYYYSLGADGIILDPSRDDDCSVIDVFVTTNVSGNIQFHHIQIPEGSEILEEVASFVEILQDPEDVSLGGDKSMLKSKLYHVLLEPVLCHLTGVETLYIAPDDQLCNLPFEILHADENTTLLQDMYKVCRLVCGRDLLFSDDLPSPSGNCFILGDPDYEAEQGEKIDSKHRGGSHSLSPVSALPFSAIEANRISRYFRTKPCVGKSATKYALQDALPCNIIHLATHGIFDEEMETDSLYSSHMVFAGYNKWVKQQTESSGCGNGVLTADEISRMDLHKTELVVLSACQSGLGDTSYRSTRGLLSAFSAAGARWIICHMWEASDFATPILMDAFYDAYLNKGKDVPEALQYAKSYLRNLTVGEMRNAGWLDLPQDDRLSSDTKQRILTLQAANDRRKPFADEFYWGGFTVHKSR